MDKKLQAVGQHILVIRDEEVTKVGELDIPEWSVQKPNTGKIISVGTEIHDKSIRVDKQAVFTQKAGFEVNIDNEVVTVLRYDQILGVYDK